MRYAARAILVAAAAAAWGGALEPAGVTGFCLAAARAADDWKKEFEEICAKTQDAMVLETKELESLVKRCDTLMPAIEALEPSQRKVYSRRLKGCRDLYQYVLDYRQQKEQG